MPELRQSNRTYLYALVMLATKHRTQSSTNLALHTHTHTMAEVRLAPTTGVCLCHFTNNAVLFDGWNYIFLLVRFLHDWLPPLFLLYVKCTYQKTSLVWEDCVSEYQALYA
jgi:hypothetical protein